LEPSVLYSREGHVGHIVLNRPAAGNAVDETLALQLGDICQQVNGDAAVHVVTVTGAGADFCVGSAPGIFCPAASSLSGVEKPVIVIINGDALGQGLELALAGDIRLCAEGCYFGLPQLARGLIPADGGTQRLARTIGRSAALEMILTAENIDAAAALRLGLVSRVLPVAELAGAAEALARDIALSAPVPLRYIKEAVGEGLDLTLEQGLRLEADLYFLIHTTADRSEGINAFRQKRRADFRGE